MGNADLFRNSTEPGTSPHSTPNTLTTLEKADVDRGRLVVNPEKLNALKSSDRYDPNAEGGISSRWLPGSDAATYCAQADEHNSSGTTDESSVNTKLQMEKRLRKFHGLKARLPEPHLSVADALTA